MGSISVDEDGDGLSSLRVSLILHFVDVSDARQELCTTGGGGGASLLSGIFHHDLLEHSGRHSRLDLVATERRRAVTADVQGQPGGCFRLLQVVQLGVLQQLVDDEAGVDARPLDPTGHRRQRAAHARAAADRVVRFEDQAAAAAPATCAGSLLSPLDAGPVQRTRLAHRNGTGTGISRIDARAVVVGGRR